MSTSKDSHHILSPLMPNQPWLCKSCYQDTQAVRSEVKNLLRKGEKTHKGRTASRSNHNWRNPVKSSTRLEHIKQIFSASISRKNISLLAMGLMKVWQKKKKGVTGNFCIFGLFSHCVNRRCSCWRELEMDLDWKGNSGWSSEQERDTLTDLCG